VGSISARMDKNYNVSIGGITICQEASDVRFDGRHKPFHGGLTVAIRATDTLKPNIGCFLTAEIYFT